MSDPYERVKGGRLTFKGGSVATSSKSIDKKNKKKKKNKVEKQQIEGEIEKDKSESAGAGAGGGEAYTIDAAKKLKYEELFPVEAKKFGYKEELSDFKRVEDALDDRVKKKADRYCK